MAAGDELANLDFESMIGGPLSAVVRAQAQSAVTSVDFIKAVGFNTDDDGNVTDPVMVTFSYDKPVETTQADGTVVVEVKKFNLTVPFLTMLPIPFIRVEETTIDFNATLTAPAGVVQQTSTRTSGTVAGLQTGTNMVEAG